MKIIATEDHRLNGSVMVNFTDDKGEILLPGGRYYDATNQEGTGWDDDPHYIIAKFSQELESRPDVSTVVLPEKVVPVEMDDKAITNKLEEIIAKETAKEE